MLIRVVANERVLSLSILNLGMQTSSNSYSYVKIMEQRRIELVIYFILFGFQTYL